MRFTRWSCGALFLVAFGLCTASAIPPRKDINPALLYFQAFSALPELVEADSELLTSSAVGEVNADERALAQRFDAPFRLLYRARAMKVRCDWGTDIADGPHAFTPHFIKIRTSANAAILRARVALTDGQPAQARDELLAISALAHNAAGSGSLVGTMVQVAVDMKILDFISAHFDQLKPQTRAELAAGLNGAPQRQSVADAMANEQSGFCDWLIDRLESFRAKNPGDEAKVLDQFRAVMIDTFNNDSDLADRIIEAADGTSAGVIRYIRAVEPLYVRSLAIARASMSDIQRETADFEKAINASTNLIARVVMPNIGKARLKELDFEARLSRLPNAAP
jgi:hypothetical protein